MADYDVITNESVDDLITTPGYENDPWTTDDVYVSEGATLASSGAANYLYANDIILGENSTGSAIFKSGTLDLTKPGFTLFLTLGIPAPTDVIAPEPLVLDLIEAWQDENPQRGKTKVRLSWELPTLDESYTEKLGVATGGVQTFDLTFDPISTDSDELFEIQTVGTGSSTLAAPMVNDMNVAYLLDTTGFDVGDVVSFTDGSEVFYYRVAEVFFNRIILETRINRDAGFPMGTPVRVMNVRQFTRVAEYDIDYGLGMVTLHSGVATPGYIIASFYKPVLQGFSHIEIYRTLGDDPVPIAAGYTYVTRENVVINPATVVVDASVVPTTVTYEASMGDGENGETWTYYLFAADDATSPNYSQAAGVMVETIPSIPTHLQSAVDNGQVELEWHALSPGSDYNTNGFNVYRCEGVVFDAAAAVRVNSTLIPKAVTSFDDSAGNTSNRRPETEVPYPQNGLSYVYKIESQDTETEWELGTKNQDAETGPAVFVASKHVT